MTDEPEVSKFQQTIQRIEQSAKHSPKDHNNKVALLAMLGYTYITGMFLLLLLITAGLIIVAFQHPNIFWVKLFFLPAIAIVIVLRSFWVKFEQPQGVSLSREDSPRLFDLISEISTIAKSPRIHSVLLTADINCAVSQIPRLGAFGYHKNTLILGLPLLQSMPLAQFKSVLAHEFGHLSELHSKFDAWIYHLQATWYQLVTNLAHENTLCSKLFTPFANWFLPKFDAHSLVLRRGQEYAADQIAVSLVGNTTVAEALITIHIKGTYTQDKLWPEFMKSLVSNSEPPKNILDSIQNSLSSRITPEIARSMIFLSESTRNITDSHPSLSERIQALGLPSSIDDILNIYTRTSISFLQHESAAQALFGQQLAQLKDGVEQFLQDELLPVWQEGHATKLQAKQQLAELNDQLKTRTLSKTDSLRRALLITTTGEHLDAIEAVQDLLQQYPEEAKLHFHLGNLLLSKDDAKGVEHIHKALKLAPWHAPECYSSLAEYFARQGNDKLAQSYIAKGFTTAEQISEAAKAVSKLTLADQFAPHHLSTVEIDEINVLLDAEFSVKEAWIVERSIPAILGTTQPVLVLRLDAKHFKKDRDEQLVKAFMELGDKIKNLSHMEVCEIINWEWIKTNLGKACKTFTNAQIYDRKRATQDNSSKQGVLTL